MEIECQDNLINFLNPDEKILWCGKPKVEPIKLSEIGMYLFVFIFLNGCLYFSFTDKSGWFWFTGLYFIWFIKYYLVKPNSLRNITYGLTNQRIILIKNSKKKKFKAYGLEGITKMKLSLKKNGIGDIDFRKHSKLIFENIENVESVYKQAQDAKELRFNK